MNFILQVDFPYEGPFGEEMSQAMRLLAEDIAQEEGLVWKIWTESEAEKIAGGIYLFDNEADARRYLEKHEARLTSFGIQNIRSVIFQSNDVLSKIDRAPL
ncbi:monooxygenase [Thiomicrolovo sp. ZZH C-3]